MVIPDILRTRRQIFGICLVVIQIQYAVSQTNAFATGTVQHPQSLSDIHLTSGTPVFTNHGSKISSQALPHSQGADVQSMLNIASQQQPSTTIAGSPPTQPGMEEMMRMLIQSSGQSASPTPEQLGFTHYGPNKPATKPLTPEQSMVNMLLQQSQGEQSNSNTMLQYLLLMNIMKPNPSSASSSASTAVLKVPEATSASAPIPAAGTSTQIKSSTKNPQANGTLSSFQNNLIGTNSSDVKVSFSGVSNKSVLPSNQAANQNSLGLKRLLLNRLLANNKLQLKQIRFFHEKNKETVITAANASNSAKTQTGSANTTNPTTKLNLRSPNTVISTLSNTSIPAADNSATQSSASTTQMPISLTTAPSSTETIQLPTSETPRERKSFRYPNHQNMGINGHHQRQRTHSIIYQNQQPYQYQNSNQIPVQNYQMSNYNNQAGPAYQTNQGQYQYVVYPNQNVPYSNQNVPYSNQNVAYPSNNAVYPNQANPSMGYDNNNLYSNYAYQQPQPPVGHNGYPQYHQFQQQNHMPFPVPGQSSFPMPNDPLLTQVNPPAEPILPTDPFNAISGIDSAEARAEYLEQNPPTEQPPAAPTTPAPVTTTSATLPSNLNTVRNTGQNSSSQWAEMLHFLSKNFPDYLSLRSRVHQTALSSPMANQFRSLNAAKPRVPNPHSWGHSNQGSQWINTTPSTTPAGEPLEIEFEAEAPTTTPTPIHPMHAANAAAAQGFKIAESVNGQIFGGNFGRPIQQRQSNVNSNFDIFGMMTGRNGAHSNGFHGQAHNTRQGNHRSPFFTNGHSQGFNEAPWTQNSKWGMNGAV